MSPDQVVRAWKDADYGACLDAAGTPAPPASPVGRIEIDDAALDLAGASVAMRTEYLETLGCCQGFTQPGMCDATAGMGGICSVFCFTIFWTTPTVCSAR
jgi:mersacidin/lichenicidin family type 2 lantibiotic